jgi:nucleotide-binding universal stress UspA family protein
MLETTPRKVMVGVTTEEDVGAAVEFAVAEARRRGSGVHLVHVVHPVLISPDGVPITVEERAVRKLGREALDAVALAIEHQLGPDQPVSTELVRGRTAGALVTAAEHAGVVVLQHQRMGRDRQLSPTLSTTNPVAALAPAPVIAVPPGWTEPPTAPVVTVGVADPRQSTEVVRAALDEARLWAAPVRILHAWHYSDAYDDLVFIGGRQDDIERRELMAALEPLLATYPDIEIDVVVRRARAADALVEESGRSSLVVVGRHRHTIPLGPHLGSVVRAVLRHATCPVMVVDPVPTRSTETAATPQAAYSSAPREAGS